MEGQEITNESIQWWWEYLEGLIEKYNAKTTVKQFLNLTLSENETPIRNLGKLLDRVGYQVTFVKQLGKNKDRQRVYKIERKTDKQDSIFSHWLSELERKKAKDEEVAAAAA
jgi:hypothetical protein